MDWKDLLRGPLRSFLHARGYVLVKQGSPFFWNLILSDASVQSPREFSDLPKDFDKTASEDFAAARNYTLTSAECIFSLNRAVEHIVKHRIPGAVVECGVWKGGSMMSVARFLVRLGVTDRELYLYDTFDGWTEPTEEDVSILGEAPSHEWGKVKREEQDEENVYITVDTVRETMRKANYDEKNIHYVKGPVEETIPHQAPEQIALLRLDTDWYQSTLHELEHLYPRLSKGGVLIIDDYGHWLGARKAADEYFDKHNIPLMLNRIDYTCYIGIKPY